MVASTPASSSVHSLVGSAMAEETSDASLALFRSANLASRSRNVSNPWSAMSISATTSSPVTGWRKESLDRTRYVFLVPPNSIKGSLPRTGWPAAANARRTCLNTWPTVTCPTTHDTALCWTDPSTRTTLTCVAVCRTLTSPSPSRVSFAPSKWEQHRRRSETSASTTTTCPRPHSPSATPGAVDTVIRVCRQYSSQLPSPPPPAAPVRLLGKAPTTSASIPERKTGYPTSKSWTTSWSRV